MNLPNPPEWSKTDLEHARLQAIENFRKLRIEEPLEAYLEVFEQKQGIFEELLEKTVDLTQLRDHAIDILIDVRLLEATRYWRRALGEANVVPTAVLRGVYKLRNLLDAQDKGLTIFWAHDLVKLHEWLETTRP